MSSEQKTKSLVFDQLNRVELENTTGGLPYIAPSLIVFMDQDMHCMLGLTCVTGTIGSKKCAEGNSCGEGLNDVKVE